MTCAQKPSQQLSQIEKSVTHLLIATKQLLETLTQWSRHTATEGEVSDVYVRLGYEFNIACRAFNQIGVETTDLGPVPELLRAILEETLSQEASSASLDKFLPRIRDIIITLLHGLKRKQQRLRSKQVKDNAATASIAATTSSASLNTGLTQMLEDVPSRRSGHRGSERRTGSGGSTLIGDGPYEEANVGEESGLPSRFTSTIPTQQNSGGIQTDSNNRVLNRESQRSIPMSPSGSSASSGPSQMPPAIPPHTLSESVAIPEQRALSQRDSPSYHPAPPPPPKQQDALAALQRGGDLERRASRRYSAYQISKHLGASPNGVPMLPPAQNSPLPNRGRDVRESMNAVRVRGSGLHSRQRSNNRITDSSPIRHQTFAQRISEESNQSSKGALETLQDNSPLAKTSQDKIGRSDFTSADDRPDLSATLSGPSNDFDPVPMYDDIEGNASTSSKRPVREVVDDRGASASAIDIDAQAASSSPESQQFIPEDSPQPGKELTLFLQYKSKIKKFVLQDGAGDLSIARLQLAFIEKFAWNTHSNGNDLPEIYIQDPVSGVRHELEDLRDVKDRSVLVLNVEILDEVKRHIDEGLGGLRRMVEGVRTVVDSQQTVIQRVSDTQQDTKQELTRLSTAPTTPASRVSSFEKPMVNGIRLRSFTISKDGSSQMSGIRSLRRDLSMVRQTVSSLVSEMNTSMTTVRTNASSIKTMAVGGVVPSLDSSTGRAYVNVGKKTLAEDSEKIVNRVDDLQDVVEDLRKDVVARGVRPLPRQLETVSKNISTATADLKKMQEYLKREKPVWTKIWEKELELVCTDRDLLTMQEELATDLEDDLEKATQTFALVEQATKQQNLQSGQGGSVSLRTTSRGLNAIATDHDVDPMKAKDGVLGEVRALRPNHETRLEAIERAEKARQKELETRREGEFTKELGNFVEEGRLKKSGGVEEAERLRKAKDEKNRRDAWEKQQEYLISKGKGVEGGPATMEHMENTATQDEGIASQEAGDAEAPGQSVVESETKPEEEGKPT